LSVVVSPKLIDRFTSVISIADDTHDELYIRWVKTHKGFME
jgi:hypothetical protein